MELEEKIMSLINLKSEGKTWILKKNGILVKLYYCTMY